MSKVYWNQLALIKTKQQKKSKQLELLWYKTIVQWLSIERFLR